MTVPKTGKSPGRRLWLWRLVLLWVGFEGLLILAVSLMPVWLPGSWVKSLLEEQAKTQTGLGVTLERLEYHPLAGLRLTGLRLDPPPGFEARPVEVREIHLAYRLWHLFWGEFYVHRLLVKAPELTLESRAGETNVDALLAIVTAKLGLDAAKPEPEIKPPGPLSPIAVRLHQVDVGPVRLAQVGDGMRASLSDLWLSLGLRLNSDLDADLQLALRPGEGETNLRFKQRPAGDAPEIKARLEVNEALRLSAAASRGLQLKALILDGGIGLKLGLWLEGRALAPILLSQRQRFELKLTEDRLALHELSGTFGEHGHMDASLEVKGLSAWIQRLMGRSGLLALKSSLSLVSGDAPPYLKAKAEGELDLASLAPYLAFWIPDAELSGQLRAKAFRLELDPKVKSSGRPEALSGELRLQTLHVAMPSLALGPLDLEIRPEAEADTPLRMKLLATLGSLKAPGPIALKQARLEAGLDLESLLLQSAQAELRLSGGIADLEVQAHRVNGVHVQADFGGEALFLADREGLPPIRLQSAIGLASARIQAPPKPVHLTDLALTAGAEIPSLLSASETPLTLQTGVKLGSLRQADLRMQRLAATLGLTARDPRHGPPYEAEAEGDIQLERLRKGSAGLRQLRATMAVKAEHIAAHDQGGPIAGMMLPRRVQAEFEGQIARLWLQPEAQNKAQKTRAKAAPFYTGLQTKLRFEAEPLAAKAAVSQFRLDLPKLASVRASVKLRDLYRPRPKVDLRLRGQLPNLSRWVSRARSLIPVEASDLEAKGALKLSARLRGRIPRNPRGLTLKRLPMRLQADFAAEGVSLKSPKLGVDLEAFAGKSLLRLGPGELRLKPQFGFERFHYRSPSGQTELSQMRLDMDAGLSRGSWQLTGDMHIAKVTTEVGGEVFQDSASLAIDMGHSLGGELFLRSFDVNMPANGLVMSGSGRLSRARFGQLLPQFALYGEVDLAKLRVFVPKLDVSGGLSMRLALKPRSERLIWMEAEFGMNRFSAAMPEAGVALKQATGVVPVEQGIWLPAARPSGQLRRFQGALGDDLELRLRELGDRLAGAKLVVDSGDILAVAPKTADHEALRPYVKQAKASLLIDSVTVKGQELKELRIEGALREGLLRLDRFQAKIWEGDVLSNMALQITPDLDLKLRLRGTASDLNLDIPYAAAKGIAPVSDPDDKQAFLASLTMDMEFGLRERVVNGRMDVQKVSLPLVQRFFGAMDPSQTSGAVRALDLSERFGLRPVAATAWISQNLLNVQFAWEQLFFHIYYPSSNPFWLVVDTALIVLRPLTSFVGGAWVIQTVNGALSRVPFGSYLETVLSQKRPEALLEAALGGRLISKDAISPGR